jgi:hypothetical protein
MYYILDNVLPNRNMYMLNSTTFYFFFWKTHACMHSPESRAFTSIRLPIWEGAYIGNVQFAVYYIHIAPRKPLICNLLMWQQLGWNPRALVQIGKWTHAPARTHLRSRLPNGTSRTWSLRPPWYTPRALTNATSSQSIWPFTVLLGYHRMIFSDYHDSICTRT